jgi:hypothetical protein
VNTRGWARSIIAIFVRLSEGIFGRGVYASYHEAFGARAKIPLTGAGMAFYARL